MSLYLVMWLSINMYDIPRSEIDIPTSKLI